MGGLVFMPSQTFLNRPILNHDVAIGPTFFLFANFGLPEKLVMGSAIGLFPLMGHGHGPLIETRLW